MKGLVRDLSLKQAIEAIFTGGIVEWSTDGKLLYSTCTNVVKVVNLDDRMQTYTIGNEDENLGITCICLDNFRNRMVIAYSNYTIREFSLPSDSLEKPTVVRMWKTMHNAPVLIMKFNDDGSRLATGSADNKVKIWDMDHQNCSHTFKGGDVVTTLSFIRDERLLVGYSNGEVNMFTMMKGALHQLLQTWKSHTSHISSIINCIGSNSRTAVVISRDQTASVIETETREVLKVLPLFERIEAAVVSHNGNLITVGEEGILKEWVIESARLVRKSRISSARLDAVSYNIIRNELLIISSEQNIYLLSFDDLAVIRQIVGFQDEIYSCCVLGKDESHIAVASNTEDIRLYDVSNWDCHLVSGHKESVLCVTSAEFDRNLVASCSKDNTVFIWRLSGTGTSNFTLLPIATATGHTNSINAVRFSRSQSKPFLLTVSNDTTLKLWSLNDTKLGKTEIGDEPLIKLTCSSTIVAHGKDVNSVDISSNDSLCVTSGMDKLAKLWHIDSNKMQLGIAGTLSGHKRGVSDARFSQHTQKIVTCSGDLTIKIWSLHDRSCVQTLSGHSSAVFSAMFINSGTQVISVDSAGIIKIWNLSTGECESSIEAHTNKIWTICVNNDESEYITGGTDGRIAIWKDVSEEKRIEADNFRRKRVEEEQTLSNLLDQSRYQDALEYALSLGRPFCALRVIDELIEQGKLAEAFQKLDKQKVQILLDFAAQWNTNSRTSQSSQLVLNCALHAIPPDELLKLPNIVNTVQSFIPYTKRHMERLNKTNQDVALLNFTWDQMRLN